KASGGARLPGRAHQGNLCRSRGSNRVQGRCAEEFRGRQALASGMVKRRFAPPSRRQLRLSRGAIADGARIQWTMKRPRAASCSFWTHRNIASIGSKTLDSTKRFSSLRRKDAVLCRALNGSIDMVFQKGQGGRPRGVRNKLSAAFLHDLLEEWTEGGRQA